MMKNEEFKNEIFVWDDLYDYFVKGDNPHLEEFPHTLDYFGPFWSDSEVLLPLVPMPFSN